MGLHTQQVLNDTFILPLLPQELHLGSQIASKRICKSRLSTTTCHHGIGQEGLRQNIIQTMPTTNNQLGTVALPLGQGEDLRAQRTWLLVDAMFLVWAMFSVVFWFRGYYAAGVNCQTQALCYLVIQVALRKKQKFLTVINLYLICSGLGIFFVAISHPKLGLTVFFFPVSILVTSYLFGIRQAFYWFVASLIHFAAFYFYQYGVFESFNQHLDEFVLSMGTAFCVFFCCHQAESSFQAQTKGLVDLSSALQKRSDELEHLATTDSLTGLTNRYQFQNELEKMVELATEESKSALFLIDMDGFKEINDTLGHVTGDEVLVEIGKRLSSGIGDRASVARLGGDEFCVLFNEVDDVENADEIAKEIVELLTCRYQLSEVEVTLGTSVGYALCPDHAQTGKHILSFADTAMYHAKNNKMNIACYRSEMTERLSANRLMNEQLSFALANEEFYLVYQPQVDTSTGKMIGAEALMRWRHEGEVISPGLFIPLLEHTGRIVSVGKWIIRKACWQQAQWKQDGLDTVVSVNVSALQFIDDDFVESVIRPLKEFGVSPSKLELEITEGILIANVEQVIEKLMQLKELGCRISIDDFGTGYSSLAYLRQFPLDKLKIDRAFVKDIPDTDDGVIASSIIILAGLLELEVIAEGVETIEQLQFLKEHGCNQHQGFYFSQPVEPEEILSIADSPVDCPV